MADLDALIRAYDEKVHETRKAVEDFGKAYWESLPNYRDVELEHMLDAIIPRVQAGQIRTAQLTKAYIDAVAAEMGFKGKSAAVDVEEVTGQRGVDPQDVYKRPIIITRTQLSHGENLQKAAKAGGLRLLQLIGGDMQLAKRAQARSSMQGAGMKAYRRVLTERENCALCVVASTQRYWVEDLMPIHPGCDCNVQPLPDHLAHKHVIDEETLERAHEVVAQELGIYDRGARNPDYEQLILTTEHGEYGPVISWKETRAERRILLNKRKNDPANLVSGHLTDYVPVDLQDIYAGRVSNKVLKTGIRPYPTLADVPKISPESPEQALVKVNPLFDKRLTQSQADKLGLTTDTYAVNCVRCSLAFEMRLRGYDLVAGAGTYYPPMTWKNAISLVWKRTEGHTPNWHTPKTMTDLIQEIREKEPEGARGFLRLDWELAGAETEPRAHMLNWQKQDGEVIFYDAQVGKQIPHSFYIKRVKNGTLMYIRVSDCTPIDGVLTQISKVVN